MGKFRVALILLLAFGNFACSEINIGGFTPPNIIKTDSSNSPPPWATPTVTQAECDAMYNTPGGWQMTPGNMAKNFLCGAFNTLNENFVLAPEMKYFLASGVNPSTMTMPGYAFAPTSDDLYQTLNGLTPQFSDSNSVIDKLNLLDANLSANGGKITYQKISGPGNILTPIQGGIFYTVTTPVAEGNYEYQMQVRNNSGVGPVKTIKFEVKKSGIDPTTAPVCAGFSNTVFMDLDTYPGGGRMLSKYYGSFGQNSAMVVKFTVHENSMINIRSSGNGWLFASKMGNISTRPCDFETNAGTFYQSIDNDQITQSFYFSKDMAASKRTFYINAKHLPGACSGGYSNCAIHIDYGNYHRPTISDFGPTLVSKVDFGNTCNSQSGRVTSYSTWNGASNSYEYSYCQVEPITMSPYFE